MIVLAFSDYEYGHLKYVPALNREEDYTDTVLIGAFGPATGPQIFEVNRIVDEELMQEEEFFKYLGRDDNPR